MSEEKLIQKLLELEDNIVNRLRKELSKEFVTKNEFGDFKDRVFSYMDYTTSVLNRLDEKRIFTVKWIDRTENDLEQQKKDIVKIKQELKIN